jgi:hypothetical protein
MKAKVLFLLTIALAITACERNSDQGKERINQNLPFEAIVLGINPDCGINEIKFYNKLDKVIELFGKSVIDSVYIAGNLPDSLKVPGLNIVLDIGIESNSQFGACTMRGPTLNWVWITDAKPK